MDEITWVRQRRLKKAGGFALAALLGVLFAAMLARPFQSQATPAPPPPPVLLHGPDGGPPPPQPRHRPKVALSAAQVTASVATATSSQPGLITKADGETDDQGRTICQVDVQGQDGRHHHVDVDVASNKVLSVESH